MRLLDYTQVLAEFCSLFCSKLLPLLRRYLHGPIRALAQAFDGRLHGSLIEGEVPLDL